MVSDGGRPARDLVARAITTAGSCDHGGGDSCAVWWQADAVLDALRDAGWTEPAGEHLEPADADHTYLSMACLHSNHDYCGRETRRDGGTKKPACCKFCEAPCVCNCHVAGADLHKTVALNETAEA